MAEIGRFAQLGSQLTLEEKALLTVGADMWRTNEVERLGIPSIRVSDGPHGLRRQADDAAQFGIGGSIPSTCFPTASALGASFDPELARQAGEAMAFEARQQGVGVLLGPGVNIKRSPLCGRNFEYFSEDPVVAGVMGAAVVRGLQEAGVGASLKHFAANNQETDRNRSSSEVDERTLREIYLPAFERVVKEAQPWTVMCGYNRVNGIFCSAHDWLLTTVLRKEWGFEGLVVSDWGAVHDRVAALAAGLDLEMPPRLGVSDAAVVKAVRNGSLDEGALDATVRRALDLVDKVAAGRATEAGAGAGHSAADHHRLARQAAAECAVLLKNEGGLLPLAVPAGQLVAVLGEPAVEPRFQGGGSSHVSPTQVDIPLDELRAALGEGVEVAYAAGYRLAPRGDDETLLAEAVELARGAHTAIVFMGLTEADDSEGRDRAHIQLPAAQVELARAVAAANRRTVVVLMNGSVVQLAGWEECVPTVLECWLAGQAVGGAVTDLLTGRANPSGKLAETIPLRLEDNPSYLNFPGEEGSTRYGEGVFVGYRAYDKLGMRVSYPFGHGLSYTSFAFSDLSVVVTGSHADGDLNVAVSCRVTNSGDRHGKEVAQLYVGDPVASVSRPPRELKGFVKVDLAPGEQTEVNFTLQARDFSYWSSLDSDWCLEGGEFELSVGASSRDMRLAEVVHIDAPLNRPLNALSPLRDWAKVPAALKILDQLLLGPSSPFGDDLRTELIEEVGSFSVGSVATFAGIAVDDATIEELLKSHQG